MKKLQCELCDSYDFIRTDDGFFQCQNCGCKYTLAQAKTLIGKTTEPVREVSENTEIPETKNTADEEKAQKKGSERIFSLDKSVEEIAGSIGEIVGNAVEKATGSMSVDEIVSKFAEDFSENHKKKENFQEETEKTEEIKENKEVSSENTDEISETVKNVSEAITDVVEDAVQNIDDFVSQLAENIPEINDKISETIENTVNEAVQDIDDIISDFNENVPEDDEEISETTENVSEVSNETAENSESENNEISDTTDEKIQETVNQSDEITTENSENESQPEESAETESKSEENNNSDKKQPENELEKLIANAEQMIANGKNAGETIERIIWKYPDCEKGYLLYIQNAFNYMISLKKPVDIDEKRYQKLKELAGVSDEITENQVEELWEDGFRKIYDCFLDGEIEDPIKFFRPLIRLHTLMKKAYDIEDKRRKKEDEENKMKYAREKKRCPYCDGVLEKSYVGNKLKCKNCAKTF